MDISDLRAFVMLAETLNFTRAAEALFVSQSSLSRQIGRLESETGMQLFVRSPRSVALSEYGRVFLPDARAQIEAWEKSLHHMEQVRQGKRGRFVLGFIQDNPNHRFPELLRAYRATFPDVELELREYGQAAMTRAVESGSVDAALTFAEELYQCDQVCTRLIAACPVCAVLRCDHPLCSNGSIRLGQLAGEPLVLISRETSFTGFQNVLERCRRGGFAPDISATANIVPSLFMLVEAGMGFAFLPESAKRTAPEGVRFLQLEDCADEIATVLAWRQDNDNPCLAGFLKTASEVCGWESCAAGSPQPSGL